MIFLRFAHVITKQCNGLTVHHSKLNRILWILEGFYCRAGVSSNTVCNSSVGEFQSSYFQAADREVCIAVVVCNSVSSAFVWLRRQRSRNLPVRLVSAANSPQAVLNMMLPYCCQFLFTASSAPRSCRGGVGENAVWGKRKQSGGWGG